MLRAHADHTPGTFILLIELRLLRHLRMLDNHRSFSRAAAAMHITQPAFSRSIQALEASVGAELFERKRGAIVPTPVGRILLRHAEAIENSIDDLEQDVRLRKGGGELRIGIGANIGTAIVGPVLARYSRGRERIDARIVVEPWWHLLDRLRAREVDLILVHTAIVGRAIDITHQSLGAFPIAIVGRPDHPARTLKQAKLQDLLRYPLAGPRWPSEEVESMLLVLPEPVRREALRKGFLAIECESSQALLALAVESDVLVLLPRFLVSSEIERGNLIAMTDVSLSVTLSVAWLRDRKPSPAHRAFIDLLRERVDTLEGRAGRPSLRTGKPR